MQLEENRKGALSGPGGRTMGVKEEMNRPDYSIDSKGSSRVDEKASVSGMPRAASVDDLFAPLCGLNVHSSAGEARQSPSAPAAPAHHAAQAPPAGSERDGLAGPNSTAHAFSRQQGSQQQQQQQQGARGRESEPTGASVGSSSTFPPSQANVAEATDADISLTSPAPFPAYPAGSRGVLPTGKLQSGRGGAEAALPLSQSTSDDEQLNGAGLDERKQKRMLSNRESARRSRLRKQQHLDELRAQVARLRAENTDMMTRYGIASRRYSHITGENVVLRAHATDLTRRLNQVHHDLAAQHPNALRSLGIQLGQTDPLSSALPACNH